MDTDPYNYGSSSDNCTVNIVVKTEIKDESEEDEYTNVFKIELDEAVDGNQEQIEFNSSDAVYNTKTGRLVCVHCLHDTDGSSLADHMVTAHNYRTVVFKCHICDTKFQERDTLILHRKDCSKPPQKKRKKKTFTQILKEVERDILNVGDELENVACPVCVLELPKYELKQHLVRFHKSAQEPAVNCDKCHKMFKSKLTLREHVKMVHESVEDSVECEVCGQTFSSVKYMNNHKRNVHPTGGKVFECSVCGKSFKSHICMYQHTKSVHPPQSASVECSLCPKTFKSKINLKQHMHVSHGIRK